MQLTDVHCSDVFGRGRRTIWLSLLASAALMLHADRVRAQAGPLASHIIAPPVQAVRDDDRVEILRQELKRSEEQLQSLVRRKAERLIANDMQGANESEAQRLRTLDDIAGLKREIGMTSAVAGRAIALKPPAPQAKNRPTLNMDAAQAPWWDVYRSRTHAGLPVSRAGSTLSDYGARNAPELPTGVSP
ncbi:hypothetical protein [Variovorax paradoxus]|nr:hypothetical protein [Variovorax paradoxus]